MPVLIFHKQDKKLAMITVAILMELTDYPRSNDQIKVPDGDKETLKYSWAHEKSSYR